MPTYDDLAAFSEDDPELRVLFDTMQQLHERLTHLRPNLIIKVEFGDQRPGESVGEPASFSDQLEDSDTAGKCFNDQPYWCCLQVEPPEI